MGGRQIAVVLGLASGNRCVVAGLVPRGAVVAHAQHAGHQQDKHQHDGGRQPLKRAHAFTGGRMSYCAMFRPRMMAMRLLA